jgi:hypothetical protein
MCDTPSCFWARAETSRVDRICCECGRVIPPGALHENAVGKWSGDFRSFRTCAECSEVREDLRYELTGQIYDDEVACALAFGRLTEELQEHCRQCG